MVQIPGTYKLVENRNLQEFFVGIGVPEQYAKERSEVKGTIKIEVDGDKIILTGDSPPRVTNLVVGQEVDEHLGDLVFKSTTKIDGNVITVSSTQDGNPSTRTYTFTDSGFELQINVPKEGKTHTATQVYKRI